MNNHTTCPLCTQNVSRPCFGKHFFSRQHIDLWVKPALLAADKSQISTWKRSTTKSSCPIIYFKRGEKQLCLCFGCKKAVTTLPSYHLYSECKFADKHLEQLSKILGTDLEDDVVGQQLRLVKKMKNLEKENDNYTDQLAEANDKCDKLEELFKELAGTLKDEDRATWLERLEGIKDE